MKRKLLFTAIAIIGFATATMAQVPNYVPSNGLVGWWPFNGNASDVSGNGNNGTVNGATLTTDRFGNINSSFSFNGTSNNISIPHKITLNALPITINAWIKTSHSYGPVITKYTSGTSNGWSLHVNKDRLSSYYYSNSNGAYIWGDGWTNQGGGYTSNGVWTNSIVVDNNLWHMVTSVYDLTGIKLYCDTVLILTSGFINGTPTATTTTQNVYIGNDMINGYPYIYNGKIDDIGIWNRALTQQEITVLYQGCNGVLVSTQPSNQNVNLGSNAQFITSTLNSTATYQWQTDLGFGFQNISNAGQYNGATNDTLIVSNTQLSNNNQQFRCIITDGGCKDTSNVATLTIANIGIYESKQNQFKVYPNPASSQINVEIIQSLIGSSFTITDQIGKTVLSGKLNAEKSIIELGDLSGGIYLFSIGNNAKQTFKVIKK